MAPSSDPGPEPRRSSGHRRTAPPWWFAVPAMALFAFVVLVPSVRGVYYAFTDWDGLDPNFAFVGLGNFTEMIHDPDAVSAVWHTLVIAVSITVIQNGVGLLLALGVNTIIKSRNVLRVFLFAPAVVTPIVTAYLWRNLLGPDGSVNSLLAAVGLGSWRQDWLGDPQLALWSIIAVIVWQYAGYSMVIFLAGLQSVPAEIYEAAAIDGAGPVRRFWSVVRPLLAPAFTINLMLSIIGGIKLFDQVYALTGGGPGHATDTITLIDGCTPLECFRYVVFPMLKPITVTALVLNAVAVWNDFFTPLLYLSGSPNQTMPVAIAGFVGQYAADWNLIFAALLISILPVLAVYFALQRSIINGFAGGLKG